MQREVTVTQSVTRQYRSCMGLTNFMYFFSVHGLLKFTEFTNSFAPPTSCFGRGSANPQRANQVIGLIVVSIQSYFFDHYYSMYLLDYRGAGVYVLLIATSCTITTFLLFISNLMSMTTSTIMPKTVFEYLYHATAAVLNTTAGVAFMIKLPSYVEGYNAQMTAAVMTLINAGLYLASAVLAYITFKSS